MSWCVPPEWYGEAAFILGCGPSLSSYRFSTIQSLRNYGHVIAINDAYMLAPWAEVLYAHDKEWWDENYSLVANRFTGRYMVSIRGRAPGLRILRDSGPTGLETDPGALRHGSNSGYQAINLAYHFGATKIVLLGFDLRVDKGRIHWRERHKRQTEAGFTMTLQQAMLPKFPSLYEPLRDAGVVVLNATPNSALKVWPYAPIQDVLSNFDDGDFWKRFVSTSNTAAGV